MYLEEQDRQVAQLVAAQGCRFCGGALHHSDYERKPRGGLFAAAGEDSVKRLSLCCAREGCRKRTTPPSLRFLGRRVYLGVVVILASLVAHAIPGARAQQKATGVPARTTRRWLSWWQGPFISTEVFIALRARLIGLDIKRLPIPLVEALSGSWPERLGAVMSWLAPLTTGSAPDEARWLRGIA